MTTRVPTVEDIKEFYDKSIRKTQRLYADRRSRDTAGGVRHTKGDIVEEITRELIRIAWSRISNDQNRLKIDRRKVVIDNDKDPEALYRISQDIHVYVDDEFRISIECKSYTEVAMYKRILVDASLLKAKVPAIKNFYVVQLENFMGGDYSTVIDAKGSPSVKALNHFFPELNIKVLTLLDGDRDIKKPIHKPEYYKSLNNDRLNYAIDQFQKAFSNLP